MVHHPRPSEDGFEHSVDASQAALKADARWNTPMPVRPALLVEAFVMGVMSADPSFRPYSLPPGLADVANWVAFMVQRTFRDPLVALSPSYVEHLLTDWAQDHPQWTNWDPEGRSSSRAGRLATVATAARAGDKLDHRPYLDLHAVTRNAAIYLLDESPRRTDY